MIRMKKAIKYRLRNRLNEYFSIIPKIRGIKHIACCNDASFMLILVNLRIFLAGEGFMLISKVSSRKSIPSLLQNLIDYSLKNTRLFLIVCGSSVSFIEKEILSYKSPLYGRRTAQLIVEPFNFFESREFFPNYSFEDQGH